MTKVTVNTLKERIRVARGETPADLVLKKGRVLNVFSGTIEECDVAVHAGIIAGVGTGYHGKQEVNTRGKFIAPGFIDAHLHIESSMLLPSNLSAALLPHGTTAIIADPHEIANVLGLDGIRFLLRESEKIPLDVFFMAPSCVPASPLETSGARLEASDLEALKNERRVLGLAEVMNYPGLLNGDTDLLSKVVLFQDRIIDGHSPSVSGLDLQAYVSAGIRSDHESSRREEGLEKVKAGMMLMIRESTSATNLEALLPLVDSRNSRRICFVSDDLHPQDIRDRGHLDHVLRKAVSLGLDPVTAIQLVTLNPAEHFGFRDRGAVGPGFLADLVVLDNLNHFEVEKVYKDGRLVVDKGELTHEDELTPAPGKTSRKFPSGNVNIPPIKATDFTIRIGGEKARVIHLVPGQILTRTRIETVKSGNGLVLSDTDTDTLKLAVVERHHATGRIGLGLVKGFGLKQGALASTVAHDSHNLIVVGVEDRDLQRAVNEIKEIDGGMVAVADGEVLARVPLQIAGLLSREGLETVAGQVRELNLAAAKLGCVISDPFMALSFVALPVIPELKLTDRGLVDVNKFAFVPLFIESH
jgi:adenine deaminase